MARQTINLGDLRSDPEALKSLMHGLQSSAPKKKIKVKKQKPIQTVVLVETPNDPPVKKTTKPTYDDDTLSKYNSVLKLIKSAEGYFNQATPGFASMAVLFASAYRNAEKANRALLAQARQLCKDAETRLAQKERAREKLKKKKMDVADIRKALVQYSTKDIQTSMKAIFKDIYKNLSDESSVRAGKSYDDVHLTYHVDLSSADTKPDSIILKRADIMITALHPIDLREAKRNAPLIEIIHVEGPIYAIKKALIMGFKSYALPRVINEDSLEAALASEGIRATPIAKQMRHPTSNRVWFFVPEYSKITTKTISFADRSLNSEFETLKSLSNEPTPDDIRFLFMRLGLNDEQLNTLITRWEAVDTHRGRLTLLHNEYQDIKRAIKTKRLRDLRESFLNENIQSITNLEKMKDRIVQIDEAKANLRTTFSTLASKTGRPDQGLLIGQYNRIDEAFREIENSAVRGNPDTMDRVLKRKFIRQDKLKCREIRHEITDITHESKALLFTIKHTKSELERQRRKAFEESSGA